MGIILSKLTENFDCKSECSINHELHDNISKIKFCEMNLTQKEIKAINKIIKKDSIRKKKSICI